MLRLLRKPEQNPEILIGLGSGHRQPGFLWTSEAVLSLLAETDYLLIFY